MFDAIAGLTVIATICLPYIGGLAWFSRRKVSDLNELLVSGRKSEGRISRFKRYLAKGGWAIKLTYEFRTIEGASKIGKLYLLAKFVERPERFAESAMIPVVYLKDRPSVSIPNDLLSVKLASAEKYKKLLSIAWPVNLAVFVVVWPLLLFLVRRGR